jgi:3-oxoacyl-[acyl-carrier-protein] synthase II
MALIKAGRADVVLAGGVEPLSELSFSGFAILKSLTTTVLRPFDEARSGTMLGEAGVILVLESAERARRRGAHIWGEVCGYGLSNDANHATAPDPTGGGAALAVRRCLRDTGWSPDTIDYVNAHGTGTQYNDPMELSGLRTALGPSAERTPISSTKSLHGHTLSCAGSLEAVVVLAAMSQSCIPGNIGLTNPIADFASWRLPTGPEAGVLTRVLSTSFGFAGNNCCLALGAFRG